MIKRQYLIVFPYSLLYLFVAVKSVCSDQISPITLTFFRPNLETSCWETSCSLLTCERSQNKEVKEREQVSTSSLPIIMLYKYHLPQDDLFQHMQFPNWQENRLGNHWETSQNMKPYLSGLLLTMPNLKFI